MSMIKLYKVVFLQGENTGAVGKFPLVISRSGLDKWELTWTLTSLLIHPLCTSHKVRYHRECSAWTNSQLKIDGK